MRSSDLTNKHTQHGTEKGIANCVRDTAGKMLLVPWYSDNRGEYRCVWLTTPVFVLPVVSSTPPSVVMSRLDKPRHITGCLSLLILSMVDHAQTQEPPVCVSTSTLSHGMDVSSVLHQNRKLNFRHLQMRGES